MLALRMQVAACLATSARAVHDRERGWEGRVCVGLADWSLLSRLLTPPPPLTAEPLRGAEGKKTPPLRKHSRHLWSRV